MIFRTFIFTAKCGAFVSLATITSCSHMNDDQKTRTQATVIGAAGGAAAGAGLAFGIAKLSGANDKTAGLISAGGALVGGLFGYNYGKSWGDSIVKKKTAYRNQEEYLDANIEQMDIRLKQVTKENNALQKTICEVRAEKQRLKQERDIQALKEFNKALKNDIAELKRRLAQVETELQAAKKALRECPSRDRHIALKDRVSRLQQGTNGYRSYINQLQKI